MVDAVHAPPLRVGLVSCSSLKLDRPAPARALYTSDLFRLGLAVAEATCDRVFVLSAKLGLVELDEMVIPYDQQLPRDALALAAWGTAVLERLVEALAKTGEADRPALLVVYAGERYAAPFRHLPIEEPLRGLATGYRRSVLLAKLREMGRPIPALGGRDDPPDPGSLAGQLAPQIAAKRARRRAP